ncbi:exocyst complex component EXO84B, partial [Olea europaea subsp. europaea]
MTPTSKFQGSGNKIVRIAETEAQQIALLANASLLADELLPRAAMKLSPLNQAAYKDDPRGGLSERQNRVKQLNSYIAMSVYNLLMELYAKLNRMAAMAADMFDDIEEGPRPLGPLGLQQFYLDMKFVICFASQGRYLSRNLRWAVNDIISKALAAFSATGMDPY